MGDPAGRWVYVRRDEPKGPSQVYTVRLPETAIERLRSMARARGEKHTALARAWLLDRIAAEEQMAPSAVAEEAIRYDVRVPRSDALEWVREQLGDLEALCARYGLEAVGVFGSVARGDFRPHHSDVDLWVRFERTTPAEKAARYLGLLTDLGELFDAPVDIVDADTVRNPFMRRAIDRDLVILYGRT